MHMAMVMGVVPAIAVTSRRLHDMGLNGWLAITAMIPSIGQIISIVGVAQTNERVSEFLRNALYNSTWLEKPDLVEIRASNVAAGTRDQRRLFDFSMRVTIKRQQAAQPNAGAKPAPTPVPAKAS